MRTDHCDYRRAQLGLSIALCVYVSVALGRETVPGRGEIFPIASWSLFSVVPNQRESYGLRVLSVHGKPLEEPRYFEDSPDLFDAARSHAAHTVIDRLGRALRTSAPDAHSIREKLEHQYLKEAGELEYQIVARTYDPLERQRTGHIRQLRVLHTFHRHARTTPTDDPPLTAAAHGAPAH